MPTMPATELRLDAVLDWMRNLIAERDRLAAEVAALKAEPADPDAAAVEAMADAIREAGHAAPPRTPLDSKLLARAALAAYRKLIDGEAH